MFLREKSLSLNSNIDVKYKLRNMNEYIFYTTEGHTEGPNEDYEVENCQLLGRACGINKDEAQKNLLEENRWIAEAGFVPERFLVDQVLTKAQRSNIKLLIDYLKNNSSLKFQYMA